MDGVGIQLEASGDSPFVQLAYSASAASKNSR